MNKDIEQLVEEWDCHQGGCAYRKKGKWGVYGCDMNCKNVLDGLIPKIASQAKAIGVREGEEKMKKAYGGCEKCYGKGYSTVRHGYTGIGDFPGDKGYEEPVTTHYTPCSCERGKQFNEILLLTTNKD